MFGVFLEPRSGFSLPAPPRSEGARHLGKLGRWEMGIAASAGTALGEGRVGRCGVERGNRSVAAAVCLSSYFWRLLCCDGLFFFFQQSVGRRVYITPPSLGALHLPRKGVKAVLWQILI